MSRAFKCDRCGDFREGRPTRYRVSEYESVNRLGNWTGRDTVASVQLCDSCGDEFESVVLDTLGGSDE